MLCSNAPDAISSLTNRYIEWSSHEPEPGVYDFTGDQDLVTFLKTAAAQDLLVILRPGPFIDAERDFVSTFTYSSCN